MDPNIWLRVIDERQQVVATAPTMGLVFPWAIFPEPQPFDRNKLQGQNYRTVDDAWFRLVTLEDARALLVHHSHGA